MRSDRLLPELLAPCGSPEALEAAIAGGADAVYAGGLRFNARMSAKNFDETTLPRAVERCHENGVRFYTTLNTSLYDRELADALAFAAFLYSCGVDALIVTDLGLVRLIRQYLPDLELHASTQLSGHNTAAAGYLAREGFTRMVCARELDRDGIARLCADAPLEIEMFIHGAHCVSASGQCLMSAMIGGRSGNRGACAQPCRLPYNGGYPLSLKDMCLAPHITEILSLGVASLKIEGRLKSPSYVYGVTSVYRRLLDERRNATAAEMKELAGYFSRSGFTDGYFTGSIGASMLGVRSESDKSASRAADRAERFPQIRSTVSPITVSDRSVPDLPKKITAAPVRDGKRVLSARFARPDQIPAHHPFTETYLPLASWTPAANGVILPPVIFDREADEVRERLKKAREAGAVHALCGNIGHMALAAEAGFTVHGDFRLNLFNSAAAAVWESCEDVILSPELILPQIRDVCAKKCVIVYGRLPLMLLEKRCGARALRDRRGVVFPVMRESGRDVVLNSVPIWMADRAASLAAAGVTREHFIFTDESPREVARVIAAYHNGEAPTGAVRRIAAKPADPAAKRKG